MGATLPIEPWNHLETPEPVLEESWLSSLDVPCPADPPSPHDHIRTIDNVTIYSGGFNDSSEDILSSANPPVHSEVDYRIPTSFSRHPSDPSSWDDSLSSLSSFTAESESDFHSPTWSSFSRRSSGHDNASSIFQVPSRPYSLVGALDGLDSAADISHSSVPLSEEDLVPSSPHDDAQISTLPSLSAPVDFHPGTSAETIRPSPSQLIGLRMSERLSLEAHSRQSSISSSQSSSSLSPPFTRPVTPNPSESSYLSMEESDEDYISYDRDAEPEVGDADDDHQDGSEVETVCDHHGLVPDASSGHNIKGGAPSASSEQPQDGEGSSGGHYGGGRYNSASPNPYGHGSLGGRSSGTRGSRGGTSGSGGGRDGNGRRPSHPSIPPYGAEEEEDTDSADEYGEDEPSTSSNGPGVPIRKQSSDEDNVPLARSIPTALKAQKSIRKQVKEESVQRRHERALRMQAKMQNISGVPKSIGPSTGAFQLGQTSPPRIPTRTQTLPPPMTSRRHPFAVDDLTRKLADVQASMTPPNNQELHRSGTRSSHQHNQEPGPSSKSRRPSQELHQRPPPAPSYPIHETFQKPTLRPMRSFHRPTKPLQQDTHEPLPTFELANTGNDPSLSARRPQTGDPTTGKPPALSGFSLRRSRSTKLQSQARPMDDDYETSARPSFSRPSAEISADSRAHWSEKAAALPPVPPIPTYDTLVKQKSEGTWQQKVFLGDMQRSTLVEIGTSTTAQDIIDAIESRGEMGPRDASNNGGKAWMLFELAHDFGMGMPFSPGVVGRQLNLGYTERPIRCFETVTDIRASWSKEKTVNSLLLKRTALSSRLSVEVRATPHRFSP